MNDDAGHKETRCGFVAIIGAPNAGKSTLINALVGGKVAIVSPKVQTTRTLVRGIVLHKSAQIIFIDTPGIFAPSRRLEKAMVAAAWQGSEEADVILLVVDASRETIDRETRNILSRLKQKENLPPVCLVLNKVDAVHKPKLLVLAQNMSKEIDFAAVFMISALKNDGVSDILDFLCKVMPQGPWHYPEDQISDMPSRLLAAEITREKLFLSLRQELPYALTVETEQWEEFDNGSVRIDQTIYVVRESHRAIILGKGGSHIGAIGEESRKELQEIFGHQVHLKLFVKVRENWHDDPERYKLWGLDFNA